MGRELRQKIVFFSLEFYITQFLIVFVQILGKFQQGSSIQIIPTKNLIREFKSYRNFSEKIKVNEFYFIYSAANN
jgi:hypothetical protein